MAALLVFGVAPRLSSSSSSSSSFLRQPCRLKASMQNSSTPPINPNFIVPKVIFHPHQPHKWSFPQNHCYYYSFTDSTSIPPDSLIDKMAIEYECQMKALKHLLSGMAKVNPLESLNMIDAIQHLGIEHCFKEEIEAILQSQYTTHYLDTQSSLYEVALSFRLLRQHGHFVSSDVFETFMDKDGKLDKEFNGDIKGLMSLYEASQLCLPEEDKLERIGDHSRHMLETHIGNLDDDHLANHLANSLAYPLHKSWGKLFSKHYIGFQHEHHATNSNWIHVFQQMARLHFNRLQNLYHQEVSQFSRWWKNTKLSQELPLARDQPLKWYICTCVMLKDPKFSEERVDLAKSISFIYLIDDIYDLSDSFEELKQFTEAIQRWDLAATDNLAQPMKICYKKLYETTNEISQKCYRKHGWNPIDSTKKSWGTLCDAFLVETEWFRCGHSPSAKQYLENGIMSTGVHVVLVHIFILLGQQINNQALQLLNDTNPPPIVSSTASILRLTDDLGTAQDEKQEGYDGSFIKYYMKENPEVSFDSARRNVTRMISEAWKRLNQESLSPNLFPRAFIEASQNIARCVPLLYSYDENQSLPALEKLVESLLYESYKQI